MIVNSYRRMPHFLTIVMALFLLSSQAFGQTKSWSIAVDTPDGYGNSGSQSRRVFTRRFAMSRERNRIEITVQEYAAESVEEFLRAQIQSTETEIADSMKPVVVADHAGQSLSFRGTYEFRGKSYNTRRRVAACWLSKGVFLRMSSLLVFPGESPSAKLIRASKNAMQRLVSNIKLTSSATSVSETPNKIKRPVAKTDKTKTYTHESTIPFSFEYPANWYVGDEDVQAPGSLWVVATPFSEQAAYAPLDQVEAALRVNVIGFLPEIFGVEDSLGLATKIVLQRFATDSDYVTSVEKSGLLGSANGQLVRYTPARGKSGVAGHILVVTLDSSLLVAEFSWPSAKNAEYEQQSLKILASFKIEFDRSVETVEKDGIAFEYAPSKWELEEFGTSDRSGAWTLNSGSTELFLRSVALKDGAKTDAKTLRNTCELLLGRELGLASSDILADSTTFNLPRVESTWRCFFFHDDKAKEAFAMIRDGAFHLAILSSQKGLRSFDVAQAMSIFAKMKGPQPSNKATPTYSQLLKSPCRFASIRAEAFEVDGTYTGPLRSSLDFRADGIVRISDVTSETEASLGTYVVTDKKVTVKIRGQETIEFTWTTDGRGLRGSDGRMWYVSSGM